MKYRVVLAAAVVLWLSALVPVTQQVREELLYRSFNREWAQYQDFDLPLHFAGRRVEIREDSRVGGTALVSVLVDNRVVLPAARIRVSKDTNNLIRYHRSISQSKFKSLVRSDTVMLLGRLVEEGGGQTYDLLTIDRFGRLEVKTGIPSAREGTFLQYRVLSQLGNETPSALPFTTWSALQRLGGSFSGAFILGVIAPWIVLAATTALILRVLIGSSKRQPDSGDTCERSACLRSPPP